MLEQARIGPGSRVLEIGSGGYNAALIAEIVGANGSVTSVDIDADAVDRARTGLAATGHQVTVAVADGTDGYPPHGPYDAIIVTVEAADIPPAWIEQLTPDGVLVVPLRMRGNTRSIAFTRHGDRLAATSMILCGFVKMQGNDAQPEQHISLDHDAIVLRLDDASTRVDPAALTAALDGPRLEAWSPVTMPPRTSFETLLLWLASRPVPYGRLVVDRDRTADRVDAFAAVIPAFLTTDSLAYLALRRLDEQTWQFGAHGFGPAADSVTAQMIDAIVTWNRDHRHGPDPQITVHPAGAAAPGDQHTRLVLPRRHTTIVVTWPAIEAAA
jgi:protein-L-isoaspartate(D-aspartate) O-methyltransferase